MSLANNKGSAGEPEEEEFRSKIICCGDVAVAVVVVVDETSIGDGGAEMG